MADLPYHGFTMTDQPPITAAPTAGAGTIFITGASGALGGALARRRAGPGVRLLLWGRDGAKLAQIAATCTGLGAEVAVQQVDQADVAGALAALAEADTRRPLAEALLVAGQGDSAAPGAIAEDAAQVARLAQVNFAAPAALAAAIAERMAGRGQGRILLVGSAAAFHALPNAPAYAASKAGLARFAQALRIAVAPHAVQVTLVSPGFIDWAGGGRPVPRLLLISLDDAARRILAAFDAGIGHAIIPRRFALLRVLDRLLPAVLREPLLRRLRP